MGKMKANRKFREADERAVSAVIGVILMVAITVAIAATVYVYVSGMIGGTKNQTPNVALSVDTTNKRLVVATADLNIKWADITVTASAPATSAGPFSAGGAHGVYVTAGDYIAVNATAGAGLVSVTLKYTPTNSLLGTWNLNV
jgi:flagellin-like protein